MIFICFITIPSYTQKKKYKHRLSFSTSYLVQNNPLQEFSLLYTDYMFYSSQYNVWRGGNVGMGFGLDFTYDLTLPNNFLTRFQTGFETSGQFLWTIDIGIGARIPVYKRLYFLTFEFYFTTAQTAASLKRVGVATNEPTSIDVYTGFFGFKGRFAFEFPLSKSWYGSIFISYSAYPWSASNTAYPLFINGIKHGAVLDSLKMGIEIGFKL